MCFKRRVWSRSVIAGKMLKEIHCPIVRTAPKAIHREQKQITNLPFSPLTSSILSAFFRRFSLQICRHLALRPVRDMLATTAEHDNSLES
jgi:hypothetical protein